MHLLLVTEIKYTCVHILESYRLGLGGLALGLPPIPRYYKCWIATTLHSYLLFDRIV